MKKDWSECLTPINLVADIIAEAIKNENANKALGFMAAHKVMMTELVENRNQLNVIIDEALRYFAKTVPPTAKNSALFGDSTKTKLAALHELAKSLNDSPLMN